MLARKWFPMTQLLVEFHWRFEGFTKEQHNRVVKGLEENGFREQGHHRPEEMSFIRVQE
jgi:hypothetical protein